MASLFKFESVLVFWLIFISWGRTPANPETKTSAVLMESPQEESKTLLKYYKILAKSGFLQKSQGAKFIASIKRMDIETSYAEHHICAGAVISEQSVLTSAECTFDQKRELEPNELTVVVGIQFGSMFDQYTQISGVKKIRRHSNYDDESDEHNIAILVLNDTIASVGDTVQACPIATSPPTNYEACIGVGYGVLYYKNTKLSQMLEGELKIWPQRLCETYLKQHNKDKNSNFCAGDFKELKSPPCKIVASEPLFCHDTLYGVSVFSIGCESNKGYASVYVKLWEYHDWIYQEAEMLRDRASLLNFNAILMAAIFAVLD